MIDAIVVCFRRRLATRRPCSFLTRLLACLSILVAGCDPDLPGKPNPKERPIGPENVLAFDALYNRNCAGCHGKDGKQGPAPPLNDPLFRALVPVSSLEQVLNHGRPGTPMPPFAHANGGTLSAAQIQVILYEIKGVRYRIVEKREETKVKVDVVKDDQGVTPSWGAVGAAAASLPPYELPETNGNEDQGARLFARACASCHGRNGAGVDKAGQILRFSGKVLKINEPAFLALISDQALRRIMITGRPDLGMPNFSQKAERPDDFQALTSADIADLGALLRAWRQGKSIPEK